MWWIVFGRQSSSSLASNSSSQAWQQTPLTHWAIMWAQTVVLLVGTVDISRVLNSERGSQVDFLWLHDLAFCLNLVNVSKTLGFPIFLPSQWLHPSILSSRSSWFLLCGKNLEWTRSPPICFSSLEGSSLQSSLPCWEYCIYFLPTFMVLCGGKASLALLTLSKKQKSLLLSTVEHPFSLWGHSPGQLHSLIQGWLLLQTLCFNLSACGNHLSGNLVYIKVTDCSTSHLYDHTVDTAFTRKCPKTKYFMIAAFRRQRLRTTGSRSA